MKILRVLAAIAVFAFFIFLLMTVISDKKPENIKKMQKVLSTTNNPRIKLIEKTTIGRYNYQLVEVDSHQYLISGDGGIIHIESCNCKNH
jgi:flagellar biogenesis protein FliO